MDKYLENMERIAVDMLKNAETQEGKQWLESELIAIRKDMKRKETRLGFLKRGDYFVFDGIKYKVIKLLENTNGYVACLDEENKKIKRFHIDVDVEIDI